MKENVVHYVFRGTTPLTPPPPPPRHGTAQHGTAQAIYTPPPNVSPDPTEKSQPECPPLGSIDAHVPRHGATKTRHTNWMFHKAC